jgi:glycosyltransferase involved in cell wall biosynthesis
MKICFITDISTRDVFGLEFVNAFAENHEVSVITFSGFDSKKVNKSVTVYHRCLRGRLYRLLMSVRYARERLKEINPDVVISLDAGRHAFISVLTGFHPFILFSYGSDVSYRAYLLKLGNLVTRYVVLKADCILAQDKVMYGRLLELGVKPEKIFICHWGVDTKFFHPIEAEKDFDIVNIHGYNVTFYRYINVYLEALKILKDRGVVFRALLVGNEGFYDDLIQRLGIGDVLEQKGFLDEKGLRDVFWRSRVMVDPMYPKYHDGCGYGVGLVQAMACGVPLVCADRECIMMDGDDRWYHGLVFRHGDAVDLADKIMLLLGDDVICDDVSRMNRLSVKYWFNREHNLVLIEHMIQRVIDKKEVEMNDTKALKIFESCIDEMYRNSSPPTTWKQILEQYSDTGVTFYDKHRITETDYDRIKESYIKKLDKFYQRQLDWFLLGYAPTFD